MKSESDKILSMLEEGTISAEEAEELLEAVEDSDPAPASSAVDPVGSPPDMDQVRSAWRVPFNISLITTAISGSLLWRFRRRSGPIGLILRLLLLPVTIIAGISALFIYISKDGPWLHLRVQQESGSRFAISLPFPLHLIRGALRFIQSQVPDQEAQEQLDAAADFLEAVEVADIQDPVTIDVRENGESVQIYLG